MTRLEPLLLHADNFTPPTRTPWGGTRVLTEYKADAPVDEEKAQYPVVGESWELSVEPDFPSRVENTGEPLADVLGRDPETMLGETAAVRSATALLIKLLDAADELSVQIHPRDDYGGLRPGESGKPESWYVLDADEDAGLYLGFREGVTPEAMREALEREHDVSRLLYFTPVAPGDFFVIPAGTAHAIGRGITLVEPQRVLPGKRGVTYRYWDWNRRYDDDGRPDPTGSPRTLHVEEALDVTDWDGPRERTLLGAIHRRAGAPDTEGPPHVESLGGPGGPVDFAPLRVERLAGTGRMDLSAVPRLRGLTVVGGTVRLQGPGYDMRIGRGRTLALPAELAPHIVLDGAHALLAVAD